MGKVVYRREKIIDFKLRFFEGKEEKEGVKEFYRFNK